MGTQLTINIEKIMNEHKTLSLRKIAAAMDVNYNMLLKAARKPIEGTIYDPNKINWFEVNRYIILKSPVDFGQINWAEVAAKDVSVKVADIADFVIGEKVRLRNDDNVYEVAFVSEGSSQIVIYDRANNVLRMFKAATFLHQGPKLLAVVEEEAEKVTINELMNGAE